MWAVLLWANVQAQDAIFDKAELNRVQSKYDSAIAGFERYLLLDESSNRHYQAKNKIAECYINKGNYKKALDYLRGYEVPNEFVIEKSTQINYIGKANLENNQYAAAIDFFTEAYELRKSANASAGLLANSLLNIGQVYYRTTEYDTAISILNEAIEVSLIDSVSNLRSIGKTSVIIGNAYFLKSDYDQAIVHYSTAEGIFESLDLIGHPDYGSSINNLGAVWYYKGYYAEAIEYFEKGLEVKLRSMDPTHSSIGSSYNNIASVYAEMGELEKAWDYMQQGLQSKQALLASPHTTLGHSYAQVGTTAMQVGNFDQALEYHKKELKEMEGANGPSHPFTASAYTKIAQVLAHKKEYDSALIYIQKSQEILMDKPDGNESFESNWAMAQVLVGLHEKDAAVVYFKKSIHYLDRQFKGAHPQKAEVSLEMAQLYFNLGKLEESDKWMQQAYHNISQHHLPNGYPNPALTFKKLLLLEIVSFNLKLVSQKGEGALVIEPIMKYGVEVIKIINASFTRGKTSHFVLNKINDFFKSCVQTFVSRHNKQPSKDLIEKAWYWSEYGKAQKLKLAQNETRLQSFAGVPPHLLETERALLIQEQLLWNRYKSKDLQEVDALVEVRGKIDSVVQIFKENHAQYYQLRYEMPNLELKEFQSSLNNGDLVLFYQELDGFVVRFDIRKESCTMHNINAVKSAAVEQLNNAILTRNQSQFTSLSAQLYGALLPSSIPVEIDNMYVIPDGILYKVPFDLLKQERYLFEEVAVSYSFSCNWIVRSVEPDFELSEGVAFAPGFEGTRFKLLPSAAVEVATLSEKFNIESFVGQEASVHNFIDQADGKSIVHLATHTGAEYAGIDALYFSDSTGLHALSAEEIYNLNFRTLLLTLSACSAGKDEFLGGEGMMSLNRAFAFAGSQNLLSARWEVSDQATAEFFDLYYTKIADGQTASHALKNTRMAWLNRYPDLYDNPFIWGSWMYYGQNQTIQLNNHSLWIQNALFVMFLGVFAFAIYKRRQRLKSKA